MVEYVGLDVSKEETAFCVKDKDGKVLAFGKVATDPEALFEVLGEPCPCPARVVMETGTLSGRLARELRKRGPPVAADRRPPGARGDAASAQQDGWTPIFRPRSRAPGSAARWR